MTIPKGPPQRTNLPLKHKKTPSQTRSGQKKHASGMPYKQQQQFANHSSRMFVKQAIKNTQNGKSAAKLRNQLTNMDSSVSTPNLIQKTMSPKDKQRCSQQLISQHYLTLEKSQIEQQQLTMNEDTFKDEIRALNANFGSSVQDSDY